MIGKLTITVTKTADGKSEYVQIASPAAMPVNIVALREAIVRALPAKITTWRDAEMVAERILTLVAPVMEERDRLGKLLDIANEAWAADQRARDAALKEVADLRASRLRLARLALNKGQHTWECPRQPEIGRMDPPCTCGTTEGIVEAQRIVREER